MSGRDPRLLAFEAQLGAHLVLAKMRPSISPARLDDRFEIRSILGTGGFGTVVRAWDPTIARNVAIKCVPTREPVCAWPSVVDESRAMARPGVPEIVTVFDSLATHVEIAGARIPCLAIVMELVSGPDLRRWLGGVHGPEQKLEVLVSAARGLEAAHAVGLVHRDFKPENVMVTPQNQARIVDFGLAYHLRKTAQTRHLAVPGSFGLGTPEYMAPEVREGAVVPNSDQFSFAITAWELLTGVRPFDPQSRAWASIEPKKFAGADRLSRDLLDTLARALRFDCRERFDSIAQLRHCLEGKLGGRKPLAAVLAGAAVLTTVATSGYLAGKHKRDRKK